MTDPIAHDLKLNQKIPKRTKSKLQSTPLASSVSVHMSLTYDCLLNVFSYLDIQALCRVSLVCRDWNLVSRSCHLWKEITLTSACIRHWASFLKVMVGHGTHTLRVSSSDRLTVEALKTIASMIPLRRLSLPALNLSQLETLISLIHPSNSRLTALTVDNVLFPPMHRFDLGLLASLSALTTLRLIAYDGFNLPLFSFGSVEQYGPP